MGWTRYAVYWAPDGDLGEAGADWLGWDLRRGAARQGLVEAAAARRYGFHATLKPPFRLREGTSESALLSTARDIARGLAPVGLGRLSVARLGSFVALRPERAGGIGRVADALVEGLDGFRAPAPEAELAQRRAGGLGARQEAYLLRWGYPHVFEEFEPHLTLSGPGEPDEIRVRAEAHFGTCLSLEITLARVSLVGEGADGHFRLIADLPLGHAAASDDRAASA